MMTMLEKNILEQDKLSKKNTALEATLKEKNELITLLQEHIQMTGISNLLQEC
jgi:hypothetical protein